MGEPSEAQGQPTDAPGPGESASPRNLPAAASDVPEALRMRASDNDRHSVAEVLGGAYAEGRLSLSEYNERLDAVMKSSTYGDLVPVLLDLPTSDAHLPEPIRSQALAPRVNASSGDRLPLPASSDARAQVVVAVFGEQHRSTDIVLGSNATITAVFGSARLDLSEAHLTVRNVSVVINAVFGEARVVVPHDAVVHCKAVPILGEVKTPERGSKPGPNAPVFTITGVALFGEVRIERAPTPQAR